jgi:hypothetical protein
VLPAALCAACWGGGEVVLAADSATEEGKREGTTQAAMERTDVDCRFNPERQPPDGTDSTSWESSFLPDGDVFRPLVADPKQPQIFGIIQSTKVLDTKTTSTVGSVAFGENFGLWSRRKAGTCEGIQVGLLTGVFSQFNLFDNTELINTDFVVGVPFSWRRDWFSGRVRLYHQSSHLGDQFLLARPGFNAFAFSFEELEGIMAFNTPGGGARVYLGGGYLLNRKPTYLDRLKAQWGLELRGWEYPTPVFGPAIKLVPVFAADFKAFEELQWFVNTNLLAGVEWFRSGATRRLRIMLNYYYGYNPYGQFFSEKVQNVGLGLYLNF